jgi:hypothetical protein
VDPEAGGSKFLQNISSYLPDSAVTKRNNLQYSDHALSCFDIHLYDIICQQTCWKIKIVSLCLLDVIYKKHTYVKIALFFHPSLYSTLVMQYYLVIHTVHFHLLTLRWYNMFQSSYDHHQVHHAKYKPVHSTR